jgi:hypothetical protein
MIRCRCLGSPATVSLPSDRGSVVDVRFTVGDADARRVRATLGNVPSRADAFQPTVAFFVFDGSPLAAFAFFLRRELRFDFLAGPTMAPHRAQRQTIGSKSDQWMIERSASRIAFNRPGTVDLLFGASQIQFRCVLHQQHHLVLANALFGGRAMGLTNRIGGDFVVIAKAIRGFHFGAAVHGSRDAHVWLFAYSIDDVFEPPVESAISKLSATNFVH